MVRFLIALAALLLAGAVTPASAQSYPQRPVRFILPFGPGAGVDITARLLADKLSTRWGKPVVVENRPGGDGLVAINAFISANDDHTLLFVPASTYTAHPYTHDKLPYDAERDLHPDRERHDHRDRALRAGIAEREIAGGIRGAGARQAGHAQRRGGSRQLRPDPDELSSRRRICRSPGCRIATSMQAPNDLAENRIQLLMSSYATMMPLIQAGKLKVLAVTSRKRVAIAPDVPTVAEAGFPYLGTGQPDRHLRPARHDERVAREHRGRRPGRGRRRSHHRAAAGGHRPGRRCSRTGRIRRRHQGNARPARRHRQGARDQGRATGAVTRNEVLA